jgi:chromosomal replication initiator protein
MIETPILWDGVLRRLRAELPTFAVEAWADPLVAELDPEGIRLLCPSPFHRDRVARYLDPIRRCLAAQAGRPVGVVLAVREAAARDAAAPPDAAAQPGAPGSPPAAESQPDGSPAAPGSRRATGPAQTRDAAGGSQLLLRHSFENFVVGDCNALAREASLAIAQGRAVGNPLFLVSASGLGKTHLACSIAREARRCGVQRVVLASAESFTSQLVTSIQARATDRFKRRFREGCELLILEDVQFLAGKAATQLEFFHTLEHLRAAGRAVVLTGDRLPLAITGLAPRVASILGSGIVAEIESPDAQVRRAILRSKAAAGGVHLPAPCLDLLVETVRGSVRDLEGVLTQLVASSVLLHRPVDLELTELALRKVEPRAQGRDLSPEEVVKVVAAFFQTTPEALAQRSRRRDLAQTRKLAMYLAHRYTGASLAAIGHSLGRRHSAVRNAITSIERAILERAPLRYQVERLTERIEGLRRAPDPKRRRLEPARGA